MSKKIVKINPTFCSAKIEKAQLEEASRNGVSISSLIRQAIFRFNRGEFEYMYNEAELYK